MIGRLLDYGAGLAVRLLQLSLVAIAYLGYQQADLWIVVNAILALVVTLLPAALERDRNVTMDVWIVLAITVAVVVHTVGIVGGYREFVWFDDVAHVTSASVVAAIGYATARSLDVHAENLRLTPKFTFFYLFMFVMAAGVVWELLEFAVTLSASAFDLPAPGLQAGLDDTVSDLVYDTVGAAVVGLFGTVYLADAIDVSAGVDVDAGDRA